MRHSPVNRNTRPNFSENFYITRDRASDHPDIVNNKPLVGLNRWPPDMPEFRAATTAYYAAMEAMTTRLVPIVAMALDLPADYFAESFSQPNCTIRLIHYPPHPEPEDNELDRLDTAWDLRTSSRLGCQAVIKGDVVAEFPMYTRNYVQEGGGIQLGKTDRKKEAVTP